MVEQQPATREEDAPYDRWQRAYLVMYAVYILLGIVVRALGWVHADAIWFTQAARHVLDGSFDIYSFRSAADINPPEGSAFAYSPLMAIIMAPFVGISDALGWGEAGAERVLAIPFLFADVLAMEQLRRLARAWRPNADERFLFLGIFATLFLTGFWVVTAYRGHHEGLVLLFLLLAIRFTPTRWALGGLFAGLALAGKQTAVLSLIPIGLVMLVAGVARGERLLAWGWKRLLGWTGIAAAVFAAFMLPAVIRNAQAVWYAFFTQESRRVLLGQGLPVWIDKGLSAVLDSSAYALWHARLIKYADLGLALVVVLVSAWVVWRAYSRGNPIRLVDERLLALVAFSGVAQIVFSKWVSGHYYQLPLALVLLWDTVRASRPGLRGTSAWPWVGLGGAIAFRSITQVNTPDAPWLRDLMLFALFAALAVATVWGALEGTRPQEEKSVDAEMQTELAAR